MHLAFENVRVQKETLAGPSESQLNELCIFCLCDSGRVASLGLPAAFSCQGPWDWLLEISRIQVRGGSLQPHPDPLSQRRQDVGSRAYFSPLPETFTFTRHGSPRLPAERGVTHKQPASVTSRHPWACLRLGQAKCPLGTNLLFSRCRLSRSLGPLKEVVCFNFPSS